MDPVHLVRNVIRMIVLLHQRGHESIYLDPTMAPSGMSWRYEIGAMERGRWPATRHEVVRGSIGGSSPADLGWALASDAPETLTDRFVGRYPLIAKSSRKANARYCRWFQEMERRTAPDGVPVFGCDDGPDHEHLFLWGGPSGFRMEMPPGYLRR